ncbi:hypothetical protein [Bacillus safensis]|uniref:hypothetical protein n=1 Tax=Bacillus safensis TaxID=561879 RepID=UPI00366D8AD3
MKGFIKKVSLVMLTGIVGFGLIAPVSSISAKEQPQPNEVTSHDEYTYVYKGVEFTGSTPLTEEALKNMYDDAMGYSPDSGIFVNDPGTGQVKVVPPTYRTVKNTAIKAAAEIVTLYLISRMPSKARKTALGTWIIGKFSQWTSKIKTSYIGSWVTSSYSNVENARVYHATLVHYKKKNYTKPESIEYWDISQWYY